MRAIRFVALALLWLAANLLSVAILCGLALGVGMGMFVAIISLTEDFRVSSTIGFVVFFALFSCGMVFLTGPDHGEGTHGVEEYYSFRAQNSAHEAAQRTWIFAGVLVVPLVAAVTANLTGEVLSSDDIKNITDGGIKGVWHAVWFLSSMAAMLGAVFAGMAAGEAITYRIEARRARSASSQRWIHRVLHA